MSDSDRDFLRVAAFVYLLVFLISIGVSIFNYFDQKQDYKHEVVMYKLDHPTACPAGSLE